MIERIPVKVISLDERGIVTAGSIDNYDRALLRGYKDGTLILNDSRAISPEQRRKAYAILGEIGEWMGELTEYVKELLKIKYKVEVLEETAGQLFSLSDCDVTTARGFISYLIDFVLRHDIPTKVPLYELCDDIAKYVYACLLHRKCAVCGAARADLHHFTAIGMGRDRDEICHIGMPVISLCRKCHGIAHTKGRSWLTDDYKLVAIPLTVEIGKKYKMTKKQLGA